MDGCSFPESSLPGSVFVIWAAVCMAIFFTCHDVVISAIVIRLGGGIFVFAPLHSLSWAVRDLLFTVCASVNRSLSFRGFARLYLSIFAILVFGTFRHFCYICGVWDVLSAWVFTSVRTVWPPGFMRYACPCAVIYQFSCFCFEVFVTFGPYPASPIFNLFRLFFRLVVQLLRY